MSSKTSIIVEKARREEATVRWLAFILSGEEVTNLWQL